MNMSKTEILEEEVNIIHWGQKIFVPVLSSLLLIVVLAAFATYQAVAQIELKMQQDDKREVADQQKHERTQQDIIDFKDGQSEFKMKINEMKIRQGYILEDVGDIKAQNQKILEILTDR
jgi:flagellar biosynthesis/type III secretory pathway M-ring protein FliF/YscJ